MNKTGKIKNWFTKNSTKIGTGIGFIAVGICGVYVGKRYEASLLEVGIIEAIDHGVMRLTRPGESEAISVAEWNNMMNSMRKSKSL